MKNALKNLVWVCNTPKVFDLCVMTREGRSKISKYMAYAWTGEKAMSAHKVGRLWKSKVE